MQGQGHWRCPLLSKLEHLFDRNRRWAASETDKDPGFFSRLAEAQSPECLWIGCSDSRVPASRLVDMPPGGLFVHRNIANVVAMDDLNCLSVVQYAVEVLRVRHVIVCGHYGCGGVKASTEDRDHGLIDGWLDHIREVGKTHAGDLADLEETQAFDRLCELNVLAQVNNVCDTPFVQGAWSRGQPLTVHGWIYDLSSGLLDELVVLDSQG
jgi:carbonic anhydrase